MAVNANTVETYDTTTIREDMQEAYISISPTDTPFQAAAGMKTAENTYFEWNEVDLAAPDDTNRVAEGEAAPGNDAATLGVRKGNYTQISDKIPEVSSTSEAVNGAGDIQKMSKQIAFKLKELKRDMEIMFLSNVAGSAGASGTARQTAGLPAFLITNVDRGATATAPTTSGTGEAGYPDAAAGDGTVRELTEDMLKNVIADCWENGAEPTMVMVGSKVKQKISTFTGNATRYKDAEDSKLNAAISVYISDFGELQIVPNRFQRGRDAFVLDPNYLSIAWLNKIKQKPLAKTGHADRRMIAGEYGLQVDSQKAHGIIADIDVTA